MNRLLIGWVRGGVGEADNKSATYNGTAMTKLGYTVLPTDRSLTVFYLVNPAGGPNTIAFSGGTINRTAAASYAGVNQSGQPEAGPTIATDSANTHSTFSVNLTVATAGSWLIGVLSSVNQTNTAGSGTSVRTNSNQTDTVDSNNGLAAGVQSVTITTSSADVFAGIVASFAPAPGVAPSFKPVLQAVKRASYF